MKRSTALIVVFLLISPVSQPAERPASQPTTQPRQFKRPASTFFTRRQERVSPKSKDRAAILARGRAIDTQIENYLRANDVDAKISEAMWAGRPAVGMSFTELRLIGGVHVESESARAKFVAFTGFETENFETPPVHKIVLDNDRVSSITHPDQK
jgi:hypothetical protein